MSDSEGSKQNATVNDNTRREDKKGGKKMSITYLVFGEFLSSGVIRHNAGFIIVVVVCTLFLIGNGYTYQNEEKERDKLKEQVEDAKYRALTLSSELMDRTRQSHIEESLRENGDSTLKSPTTSPFILNTDSAE